jgi:hypothetical protein
MLNKIIFIFALSFNQDKFDSLMVAEGIELEYQFIKSRNEFKFISPSEKEAILIVFHANSCIKAVSRPKFVWNDKMLNRNRTIQRWLTQHTK